MLSLLIGVVVVKVHKYMTRVVPLKPRSHNQLMRATWQMFSEKQQVTHKHHDDTEDDCYKQLP